MKKLLLFTLIIAGVFVAFNASAQKARGPRPSPPDTVRATLNNGTYIEIAYSQPGVKGRTIGKEIAPFNGKVWRTGANEATTIEFSRPVKIEGKELPAGKYGLYTIPGEKEWVIIFNSVWKIWGLNYTNDEATGSKTDVLRVTVKTQKAPEFTEKLKFSIDKAGKVAFMWGDYMVAFRVK